ncbi:MAG: hypothetical protein PVS2B2_18240 [Candidatus Acidiferrum sp.]
MCPVQCVTYVSGRSLFEGFLYILQGEACGRFYVGSTNDLEQRFSEHVRGHNLATHGRCP